MSYLLFPVDQTAFLPPDCNVSVYVSHSRGYTFCSIFRYTDYALRLTNLFLVCYFITFYCFFLFIILLIRPRHTKKEVTDRVRQSLVAPTIFFSKFSSVCLIHDSRFKCTFLSLALFIIIINSTFRSYANEKSGHTHMHLYGFFSFFD